MIIGGIVLACVSGGALLGMVLHRILPEHHLSADSKDVIKLAMGLTATMSALVLALLIASAKSSYDAQRSELLQLSANVLLLDRVLAHYGPEAKDIREGLRGSLTSMIDQLWPKDSSQAAKVYPLTNRGDILYDKVQGLSPQNE